MNEGVVGCGVPDRLSSGGKQDFSKRFALAAPQLSNPLKTGTVFESGCLQRGVYSFGCNGSRAPRSDFVEAELLLGAARGFKSLDPQITGCVQCPAGAFAGAVRMGIRTVNLKRSAAAGPGRRNELHGA